MAKTPVSMKIDGYKDREVMMNEDRRLQGPRSNDG